MTTKTGKGGFEIDGKVYDLESVDPSDPNAGIDPSLPDSGDIKVDHTKKDVSKKTRTTLARYLSDVTLGKHDYAKGVPNTFPVDPPPAGPIAVVETSLSDPSGNPTPLAPTANKAHFADPTPIDPYSSHFPSVAKDLQKGKNKVDGTDGNELLKGVKANAPGKLIDKYRADHIKGNDFGDGVNPDPKKSADVPDLNNPPADFDMKLYDKATLGSSAGQATLDKSTRVDKASKVTGGESSAGVKNSYAVSAGNKVIEITDSKKKVPTPLPGGTTNAHQFTDPTKTTGVSTGVQGDPASTLGKLSKGKKSPLGKDGHALLPEVAKNLLPEPVKSYTSTVLNNNRFVSGLARAKGADGYDGKIDSGDQFIFTNSPGGLRPAANFNPELHHPRYGNVSMGRLAQIGNSLSIRASQELTAATAGSNPTDGAAELKALLPGFNQLGASRIETIVLEAKDVLDGLTHNELDEANYVSIGELSWGSLNNVNDQWSGILAIGMLALSIALTAAIVLLFEVLSLLFGLMKPSKGSARNISGRYVHGRHNVTKAADPNAFPPGLPPDIGALLGLRGTTFAYKACVQKGTKVFFGIDDSGGIGGAILSGLKSATQTPGYNSIVARTIIRSSLAIIDAFKKAFSSPNVVAGIKNILNIIDVIRSSKLIAAANIFALLGDQVLTDPGDVVKATDAIAEEPLKQSRMDNISDDGAHTTVSKNRLNGTIKLAWASNRAPAMYLVPESVLVMGAADTTLGGFKGVAGIGDPKAKTYAKLHTAGDAKKGSSIPRAGKPGGDNLNVAAFEAALDAEYVPFSFHDLRTNEIISFHAFLASLNDDYTANYETIDGYGRVDPVKIYKSTHRKVGMSFYVVATSELDFNDMWMKINKLTTMLYPQYTRGHMLTSDDSQFVQPFSQLIGASPLIRIRLGDLFRSNYSRFALARLFGLGGNDPIKLGGTEIKPFTGAAAGLEKVKKSLAKPQAGKTYILAMDKWAQSEKAGGFGISLPLPGGTDKPKQAAELVFDKQDAKYILAKVDKVDDKTNDAVVEIKLMDAAAISKSTGMGSADATKIAAAIKKKYDNSDDVTHKLVGDAKYQVPGAFLQPTQDTLDGFYKDAFSSASTGIEDISKFLDVEKNALVKSFHSIQGKGLAGVIESMNFDWFDKVTWETLPGSTAPKMCKVTISYAPIHDISPGLDHLGYNRAPLYPVGAAMRMGKDPKSETEK